VFECNVLVQAISKEAGTAGQALALLQQNRIEVCVSRAILKKLLTRNTAGPAQMASTWVEARLGLPLLREIGANRHRHRS
jgi:hypothetical protein